MLSPNPWAGIILGGLLGVLLTAPKNQEQKQQPSNKKDR
jgi:hypothetical protein